MPGAVGGMTGAGISAPPEISLGNLPIFKSGIGTAPVLGLVNNLRRIAGQYIHRVLISQKVGSLDGVIGMGFRVVSLSIRMITQRGVDSTFSRDGVRAQRMHFGDQGYVHSG